MALTVTEATYNIWQRKKAAIDAKQSPMQEQNAPKKTTLTDNAAHGAVEPRKPTGVAREHESRQRTQTRTVLARVLRYKPNITMHKKSPAGNQQQFVRNKMAKKAKRKV